MWIDIKDIVPEVGQPVWYVLHGVVYEGVYDCWKPNSYETHYIFAGARGYVDSIDIDGWMPKVWSKTSPQYDKKDETDV